MTATTPSSREEFLQELRHPSIDALEPHDAQSQQEDRRRRHDVHLEVRQLQPGPRRAPHPAEVVEEPAEPDREERQPEDDVRDPQQQAVRQPERAEARLERLREAAALGRPHVDDLEERRRELAEGVQAGPEVHLPVADRPREAHDGCDVVRDEPHLAAPGLAGRRGVQHTRECLVCDVYLNEEERLRCRAEPAQLDGPTEVVCCNRCVVEHEREHEAQDDVIRQCHTILHASGRQPTNNRKSDGLGNDVDSNVAEFPDLL
eukprot:CAMPEP_0179308606 /NCGR_PEP_ID=MMETSP0797-20121207/51232_1 /TAXON_ID=47934 /ORGANISM="Dinophysis acuminata, Strain DAEP01" /LENGTH=260 /DNA_ID=CAMNT_0021018303 /DNA_START=137 /DNA_END=917 /DNA_ORIENTATION=+